MKRRASAPAPRRDDFAEGISRLPGQAPPGFDAVGARLRGARRRLASLATRVDPHPARCGRHGRRAASAASLPLAMPCLGPVPGRVPAHPRSTGCGAVARARVRRRTADVRGMGVRGACGACGDCGECGCFGAAAPARRMGCPSAGHHASACVAGGLQASGCLAAPGCCLRAARDCRRPRRSRHRAAPRKCRRFRDCRRLRPRLRIPSRSWAAHRDRSWNRDRRHARVASVQRRETGGLEQRRSDPRARGRRSVRLSCGGSEMMP